MYKYAFGFLLLTAIGILYEKYNKKYALSDNERHEKLIKEYLLGGHTIAENKPILWIHNTRGINARHWESFYSRNTRKVNQPYLISCIESAIKHCSNSFNICIIDDDSFKKLIDGWNINIHGLADPVKKSIREIALARILSIYGGMNLPNSTIVLKDLRPVFEKGVEQHGFFTVRGINKSSTADIMRLFPDHKIIGSLRDGIEIKKYIAFMETKLNDYTDEKNFLGQNNRFLYKMCMDRNITIIDGKTFGMIDNDNKLVTIDRLMSSHFINFDDHKLHGIYIPSDEILNRTNYQWFARLSQEQLKTCDNMIAKYLIISN
jgi:hypothetical protein